MPPHARRRGDASRAAAPATCAGTCAVASRAPALRPPVRHRPPVDNAVAERARLVRSLEAETAALRRAAHGPRRGARATARRSPPTAAASSATVARARAETARYRQLVVDLENNAPPPLLGGPGAPDDLKLIVGVGPVLERMLHQLGVTTYRQIARWTERDIDEFDARLPEFPGRIRRDGWVTQARALHQSKYGAALPARDRG